MMVQRLKTVGEGWMQVFQGVYMILGFPCALFLSVVSLLMTPSLIREHAYSTIVFFSFFWVGSIAPVLIIFYKIRTRTGLTKSIVGALRKKEVFNPDEAHEFFNSFGARYLGIDASNGTILFVNRIRKGQVDVVGLTMGDWTNRELEGNVLRLYTKYPDLPCIEIKTPWARRWYDTLGAMEYKRYSMPKPFPEYVRDHVAQLEREHQIHIPQVA